MATHFKVVSISMPEVTDAGRNSHEKVVPKLII